MDQRLRVAVIGVGGRGSWMAQALAASPRYELVAVCDRLGAVAEHVARRLAAGGATVAVHTDARACVRAGALDAVAVCTPDATHAEVAIPALEAGQFVYLEKPLDVTEEACRALIEADEAAGGRTFVGLNLRYAPVYRRIHDLVLAGAVGRPLTIEASEFYVGGRTYFRRWNRLRRVGGGLWITKACHDFDLLFWMAGAAPVAVSAFAHLSHYRARADVAARCRDCLRRPACPDAHPGLAADPEWARLRGDLEAAGEPPADLCLFNSDKDTFDHGLAVVEFANGVVASYCCNVVASFDNRQMRVSGTEGCIEADLARNEVVCRRRDSGEAPQRFDLAAEGVGGHGGADQLILDGFAEFANGREAAVVRPAEAAVAVRIGLAATLSGDEGRVVALA
ncbi:MAG: putative oxidoreductase YteT precursor [Lentisphaerae bacterium ADurb.BinA184]|nr:MAG: putative oxidoreductase YteT precursor [Lentisphaerae bacterium ADurb.BinA184]